MSLHNAFAVLHGSSVIAGLTNLNTQLNPQVQNDVGIGSPYPQFVAVTEQKPRLLFASRTVASALDLTGISGAVIDGSNLLKGYFAKLGTTGTPEAGSVHREYTISRGLIVPRRMTCAHRRPLTIDLEALSYSPDGAAHPLTIADNIALPTIPVANVEHTLGPIKLGVDGVSAKDFGCPINVGIDFGNGAQTLGCTSDVYDTHTEQPGIRSVVTLTGLNAEAFGPNGVPPVGLNVKHAGTTLFFRKRAEGVSFVADAVAEHIKLTLDGVAVVTQHTGQGTSRAEITLQIYCKWDGTLAPIQIDTTSVIS